MHFEHQFAGPIVDSCIWVCCEVVKKLMGSLFCEFRCICSVLGYCVKCFEGSAVNDPSIKVDRANNLLEVLFSQHHQVWRRCLLVDVSAPFGQTLMVVKDVVKFVVSVVLSG